MLWEQDPLWAKARLYFERAFREERDGQLFGLWCSLGLELLARAAIASVSPTLLAKAENNHAHLLYALNRPVGGDPKKRPSPRSIEASFAFQLCGQLFDNFTEEHLKAANALLNIRNEELHTGKAAFEEYHSGLWLGDFYRTCNVLSLAMQESLESLFGEDEAKIARKFLDDQRKELKERVLRSIAEHKKNFGARSEDERALATSEAEEEGARLALMHHHRVKCPACESVATVQGRPIGVRQVAHDGDYIVVRQPILPNRFACRACGLKLKGHGELEIAKLGGQHTRTTEFTPQEFYGLVDPNDWDPSDYLRDNPEFIQQLMEELAGPDYDNE